jgi:hypothetical protein
MYLMSVFISHSSLHFIYKNGFPKVKYPAKYPSINIRFYLFSGEAQSQRSLLVMALYNKCLYCSYAGDGTMYLSDKFRTVLEPLHTALEICGDLTHLLLDTPSCIAGGAHPVINRGHNLAHF